MTLPRKYIASLCLIGFVFLYLMVTEIFGRWSSAVQLFSEYRSKSDAVLTSEQYSQQKSLLTDEKRQFEAQIRQNIGSTVQSLSGIIEYMTHEAMNQGIRIESLTPGVAKTDGRYLVQDFTIMLVGNYHKIGHYINQIESGRVPMHVVQIEISSVSTGSPAIVARIDIRSSIFH
jgi:Tfp pilus assembly protein PilO